MDCGDGIWIRVVQVVGHSPDQEEVAGSGLGRNHDRQKLVIGIIQREYTISSGGGHFHPQQSSGRGDREPGPW